MSRYMAVMPPRGDPGRAEQIGSAGPPGPQPIEQRHGREGRGGRETEAAGHSHALALSLRKAASPASDTATHAGSGAAWGS